MHIQGFFFLCAELMHEIAPAKPGSSRAAFAERNNRSGSCVTGWGRVCLSASPTSGCDTKQEQNLYKVLTQRYVSGHCVARRSYRLLSFRPPYFGTRFESRSWGRRPSETEALQLFQPLPPEEAALDKTGCAAPSSARAMA
jgi:hypothetical protein